MDPSVAWKVIILIVLLGLSAFFSASEIALLSLSKLRIRYLVDEGVKGADVISKLIDNTDKLLGAILVGNNITNIAASSLATSIAIAEFGNAGVGIATGLMTLLVLIFGELTPKTIASQHSEKIALKIANFIMFLTIVFSPLISILNYISRTIIKLLGGKAGITSPYITEEELKTILDVSHEEGVLEVEEKQMIYNVVEFGDSQASDVMVPRTDMIMADVNTTYEDLINLFKQEQFSRLPIYSETYDNIIGILNVKDLFFYNKDISQFKVEDVIRPAYFTYEFKKTSELFIEMRNNTIALAIVLDEYGGTAGLVTLEDLVEEIVGDIRDEYDDEFSEIISVKENEYIVEGSARIDLVNEMLGTSLTSEDFDSIGGYIIGILGHLPEEGEIIENGDVKFCIEEIDKNRIEKIRILTEHI